MPENPSVDLTDLSEQDAMAAEWAAALDRKTRPIRCPSTTTARRHRSPTSTAVRAVAAPLSMAPGKDLNPDPRHPGAAHCRAGPQRIPIKNILHLAQASVVELRCGSRREPMDVLVAAT